jgi:DNA-binding NarL/FixJ family response regulator
MTTKADVFRFAIGLTLAGSIYIPERYRLGKRAPNEGDTATNSFRTGAHVAVEHDDVTFTSREQQVLAHVGQGFTYKQIARRLEQAEPGKTMSEHTVRVHAQNAAWKLQVKYPGQLDNLTAKATIITAFADKRLRLPASAGKPPTNSS